MCINISVHPYADIFLSTIYGLHKQKRSPYVKQTPRRSLQSICSHAYQEPRVAELAWKFEKKIYNVHQSPSRSDSITEGWLSHLTPQKPLILFFFFIIIRLSTHGQLSWSEKMLKCSDYEVYLLNENNNFETSKIKTLSMKTLIRNWYFFAMNIHLL